MSDKQFDKDLKNIFDNHSIKYDASSWHALEQKLDEVLPAEEVDSAIEHQIQEKLQHHEVPYKHTHWSLLLQRMELQENLAQNIYITKFIEAAIVLLLIFSYYHIKPFEYLQQTKKEDVKSEYVMTVKKGFDANENRSENQPIASNLSSNSYQKVGSQTSDIQIEEIPLNTNSEILLATEGLRKNNNVLTASNTSRSSAIVELLPQISNTFPLAGMGNIVTAEVVLTKHAIIALQINQETNESALSALREGDEVIATIDLLHSGLQSDHENAIIIPAQIAANKTGRIGFYSSADINIVNRPLDLSFFQQPQQYGALGSSFGLTYSVKTGRNEFEMAMAYSKKSYDPNLLERITVNSSFYDREFTEQTFRILQFPFNYKRHLVNNSSWSLYTIAGAQFNFVGHTDYEFENTLKSGQPRSNSAIENNSKLKRSKDFHQGILQGGSIIKNSYLTANVGFGIEKYFGKYSIFTQSIYSQHLFEQSLGPNNEKLNVFSLQFGTKIRL